MNAASAVVVAAVLALAGLAAWRWHKKGAPCSCGRSGGPCSCGRPCGCDGAGKKDG